MEDFWGRRECGPRFRRSSHLFGWPVEVSSNRAESLQAVDVSLPLFSSASAIEAAALRVHIVARDMPFDPGPAPDDLFTRIQYSGHGNWLALHLDAWGLAHVALDEGRALVVVAPSLAYDAHALSRFVLNTVFLNLLENRGFSLIHATSVIANDRVLLLVGDHNSGKSTTALRLALRGYDFVADSMVFIAPQLETLQLLGFPVGMAKVRGDMVQAFPDLAPLFERQITREEIKFGLDLRRLPAVTVRERAIVAPGAIDVFLVQRHEGGNSRVTPASQAKAYEALFHNSAYWHEAAFWRRHQKQLRRLVRSARCYHLALGSNIEGLLEAVGD
ncbi:MAG: hypothetical protein ACOC9Z_01845 [Chloroflexota bacterium]